LGTESSMSQSFTFTQTRWSRACKLGEGGEGGGGGGLGGRFGICSQAAQERVEVILMKKG